MASTPGFTTTTPATLPEGISFPAGTLGTGVVTTTGTDNILRGSGTLFLTQVDIGDCIWFWRAGEMVRVVAIESGTRIICNRIVSTVLGGFIGRFKIIKPTRPFRQISFVLKGGNAVISTIDHGPETLPADLFVKYKSEDGLSPIGIRDALAAATLYCATNR